MKKRKKVLIVITIFYISTNWNIIFCQNSLEDIKQPYVTETQAKFFIEDITLLSNETFARQNNI